MINGKKILFLGLDAAMPDLVKKFVAEGVMPNTEKIMNQGVFSRLETVFPPLTAAAWTAIVSGAGSGTNGVPSLMVKHPGEELDHWHTSFDRNEVLCETLKEEGFRIVSGSTDNHMVLVDVKHPLGITGKALEEKLDEVNITVNKNAIPFDEEKPAYTSGIRLGTPAMTTRGFKEEEFTEVARIISLVGHHIDDPESIEEAADRVKKLMDRFER